ncbi:hypothetical protein Tco_0266254 [Tanacetum coccineum]
MKWLVVCCGDIWFMYKIDKSGSGGAVCVECVSKNRSREQGEQWWKKYDYEPSSIVFSLCFSSEIEEEARNWNAVEQHSSIHYGLGLQKGVMGLILLVLAVCESLSADKTLSPLDIPLAYAFNDPARFLIE